MNNKAANSNVEILVVENDPEQAEQLKHLLNEYEYNVRIASNGKEALDAVQKLRPSLIISDDIMPVMDGYEMCRVIKHDDAFKDIPVMLLTGLSYPNNVVRGLSVEANNYLIKPYDHKSLLEKIDSLLIEQGQYKDNAVPEGLEINFAGERHVITANSQSILKFLISTYENVIYQNHILINTQTELKKLNQQLKSKVFELETSRRDLHASEEKFKTFIQMLPDFIYQIDAYGNFLFVNDAVKNFGYGPNELIGKHFSTIVLPVETKDVVRFEALKKSVKKNILSKETPKLFDERRTGERSTKGLELNLVPKNSGGIPAIIKPMGKERLIIEISSSGLYENNFLTGKKEFIGSVGIVRDITERKLVEGKIQNLNTTLKKGVKERTKELKETNQNLVETLHELNITQQQVIQSEKLASLGTMTAGAAHELNNTMMGILSCVQFVRMRTTDEKSKHFLDKAEKEIHRSEKIVNDILAYARPSKRELVLVDPVNVLKHAVDLLEVYSHSKEINLTINISETLPNVWANPNSLQQVFLNLLINAFDSMDESTEKEVFIEGNRKDEKVYLSLRDTGPGIPPETIHKIFNPFFTTKPAGKGTGLGLSVSANIIKGFGGNLTCDSSVGKGAKFIVTLRSDRPQ